MRALYFIREPRHAQLVEVAPRRRWVRPQIGAVYPLAETREAFAAEAHGGIPGKVTRQVLD